ncbi:zinc dependent phospholipase C family protein [Clostridium sp.]|uniref:zinc dependent phospholipase C family protein n=1 Tax=Clostridium sp. TaxID=1506 RepID=UPI003D6D4F07
MIVDTHLLISNILFKRLSNNIDFKLDRVAFAYGNVKPDFTNKDIKCQHTLEDSLISVTNYSKKLMRDDISIQKFSEGLGVVCHFACDYFCIYHRDGNEKKGAFEHLYYEMILHIRLIRLLARRKLRPNNNDMPDDSVEEIVLNLQKKYNTEEACLDRDINYALVAATQISKLIVYSSQLYFEQNKEQIIEKYILR